MQNIFINFGYAFNYLNIYKYGKRIRTIKYFGSD